MFGLALFFALPFVLSAGAVFFVPVAAAIVIALIMFPLADRMCRIGLPNSLASLFSVATFCFIAVGSLILVVQPTLAWFAAFPSLVSGLQSKLTPIRDFIISATALVQKLQEAVCPGYAAPTKKVVFSGPSLLEKALLATPSAVIETLFVISLALFVVTARVGLKRNLILGRHSVGGSLMAAQTIQNVINRVSDYISSILVDPMQVELHAADCWRCLTKGEEIMDNATITDVEPAPIYVSLELSTRSRLVASQFPESARLSLCKIAAGDSAALLSHLQKLKDRAARKVQGRLAIRLCFVIGYDGFSIARMLLAKGIDIYVLAPASFLVSRRGKRVKTDRIDAEAMIGILKAYLAGDTSVYRTVAVPTPEEEDARRLTRERSDLVRERARIISRIRGLLALHGIREVRAIWGGKWADQLDDMRTGDGRPLTQNQRRQIERCFGRLALLNDQIKLVEADRVQAITSEATSFPCPEKAVRLEQLKRISPNSSTMLVAEVFCRQFGNQRQLASFLGLGLSPYNSGSVERDQGISKGGNHGTRVLLVEPAWCWLVYQPASEPSQWYSDRYKGRGKRSAKVGIIALARKLLIALWRFVETGLVPQGAELRAT